MSEQESSAQSEDEVPVNRGRKSRRRQKRKGVPTKIEHSPVSPITLKLSKSQLKQELTAPKRRGRPPKLTYAKPSKRTKQQIKPENKDATDSIDSMSTVFTVDENQGISDQIKDTTGTTETIELKPETRLSVKKKRGRKKNQATPVKLNCEVCSYTTASEVCLDKHIVKVHRDKVMYTCPICSYQSQWNRQYYDHMKDHFPGPPFSCDYSCGYHTDRIQQILYHRMSHTDERPFECTICNVSFRSKNNLTLHARCHTGKLDIVYHQLNCRVI